MKCAFDFQKKNPQNYPVLPLRKIQFNSWQI